MAALPYQPAPDIAEVKMTYRQGTNLMSNIFHVHSATGWDTVSLVALADAFYDWENATGKNQRANSVELTYITAADLSAPDGAYSARAIDPAVGGIMLSQALPLNNTLAVTAVTGTRGRGSQGRTFWIGLSENQVDENTVNAVNLGFILENMNDLLTAINAVTGWTLVILHRYAAGVRLAEATSSPIVVYAVRDTTVDTQSNRLPNHTRASRRSLESLCEEVIRRGGSCSVLPAP